MFPVRISLLITILYLTSVIAEFSRLDQTTADAIDQTMASAMQSEFIIGTSIGLIKNGEIVYLKGYGLSDRDAGIEATEYTMYRLASVSKPFTAVAALQLMEKGDLDLHADVREYVPEYPQKSEGTITTHHILCHTSGIRHYEEFDTTLLYSYPQMYTTFDPIGAINIFKDGSLEFTPGAQYGYSTFAYSLAAAAIEQAGGDLFTNQVRDRICHKLNLPFLQPEYQWRRPYPNEAVGYDGSGNLSTSPDTGDISYKLPGGGFISTVIDLTLFIQGFVNDEIFDNADTKDTMTTERVSSFSGARGYGIMHRTVNGAAMLYHSGAQGKTETEIVFDPVTKNGVAFMCNTESVTQRNVTGPLLGHLENATVEGDAWEPIPHTLETATLITPSDNETLADNAPSFSWSEVPFASHYEVSYDTDPSFSNPISQTVRGLELIVSGLDASTTYYWRVQVSNHYLYDTTSGSWSSEQSFTTGAASPVIHLSDNYTKIPYVDLNENRLQIDTRSMSEQSWIIVTDLAGRVYYKVSGRKNGSLQTSDLSNGIYLIRIFDRNKNQSMKLMVTGKK